MSFHAGRFSRNHSFVHTSILTSHISLAVQMSNLEELWDALRSSGQEGLAPTFQHGVLIVNQVALRFSDLVASGVQPWRLESVLAASSQRAGDQQAQHETRRDLPAAVPGSRCRCWTPTCWRGAPTQPTIGASRLKDAFNACWCAALQSQMRRTASPLTMHVRHCRDLVMIGLWLMLRE